MLWSYRIKMVDIKKFEKIKKKAEEFYKSLSSVHCPYLGGEVNFNTKGLDHIKFKNWNRTRVRDDQYMRLKLVHLAPKVIKKSNTMQGYSETKEFERKKVNSRWERKLIPVSYYEFVAVLEGIRVRVIVRHVDGGQKHFWSIIPFWKMNKNNGKRILYYGKPCED